MWFTFAIIALLCWSGSDLFSKIGCQDSADKYSHLKMVTAVGIVMGLHAAYQILISGGKHRSVFMAHKLAEYLNKLGLSASEFHRDIEV